MTDNIEIRPLKYPADLAAIRRIWREVGWVDEDEQKFVDDFFAAGQTLVAAMEGEPECSVHVVDGTLRLQDKDLPLCAVTAVTTSRVARGHAFAKRLTALQLAQAAQNGAAVAALGMFDQGFYDQLGFGTGGYDHQLIFDPGTLRADHRVPTPRRLTVDDYAAVHEAMAARAKVHGSVVLHPNELMKAELNWTQKGFGLGYPRDGALTHFVWFNDKGAHGPYEVTHIAYQETGQLLQLLGLLKSLGDQVYMVKMIEPPEIQLQDLLERPFRSRAVTTDAKYEAEHYGFVWWQLRVLDVPTCVAAYRCDTAPLRLQVNITDPLDEHLPEDQAWRGTGGAYLVELAANSSAVVGEDAALPQLNCSINAFTRLLWGVARASSLAITDDLQASGELLSALDKACHLPTPHAGWDF